MKLNALLAGAATALCVMGAGVSANAAIVFNFGSHTGNLGTSETYTVSGLSIVAKGYTPGGNATDLYGKNAGGDETGLGLANDPSGDHEIAYGMGFVQLDVSQLFGNVVAASTFFSTNSTTGTEKWAVYGSNVAGSFSGPALLAGTVETSQLLPNFGSYKYYDFVELTHSSWNNEEDGDNKGGVQNFLIHDITTVTAVPEPATWAMMLVGFFGLGGLMRSNRRQATALTA